MFFFNRINCINKDFLHLTQGARGKRGQVGPPGAAGPRVNIRTSVSTAVELYQTDY